VQQTLFLTGKFTYGFFLNLNLSSKAIQPVIEKHKKLIWGGKLLSSVAVWTALHIDVDCLEADIQLD
jgi:hypothetical protein